MSAADALVFENVSVRYEHDGPAVVEGVTFSLAAGERAVLAGLNGSGKTTLLMAAAGLVHHEGRISVLGTALSRRTAGEVRDKLGFLFNVPEDQLLFPKVIEDAAFGLLRRGADRTEAFRKAADVLSELGVGGLAGQPLHHLSHGQKQRVALAGALVTAPPLLLFDEPSAGLDPRGKPALVRLIGRLGAAMLVATHDLDFAAKFCRRFIVLDGGRIAYDGPDVNAARALLEPPDEPAR